MRPPWRSTIQAAMARPRPAPPSGASLARQKRSKTRGKSSAPDARTVVVDGQRGPAGGGRHADRDVPIGRSVLDSVVDQDRAQLSQPQRIAAQRCR